MQQYNYNKNYNKCYNCVNNHTYDTMVNNISNVIIKGLDNGYLYTKDSNGHKFKSAFTKNTSLMDDSKKIIINGETYYFGTGKTCPDADKIDSDVNRICTLANLCHTGDGIYYLVVNLPISQYLTRKEYFRQMVMDYNKCEVVYNDKKLNFRIEDVSVLPQGVASIYTLENQNQNMIIIDVGSYTINMVSVQFVDGEYKITNSDTIFKGIMHYYKLIVQEITHRYPDVKLELMDAQGILINGFYYEGEYKDISFLLNVTYEYLSGVFENFKTTFPYKTSAIYVTGGGAELLFDYFKATFVQAEKIPNSQFSNALGCYYYGINMYGGVSKTK